MDETLIDTLDAATSVTYKGYTFLDNNLDPTHWSFAEITAEARRVGACLHSLGLARGDRLALVLNSPEDFVLSFLGCVSAGIMPVPMYPPLALGRMDNYIERALGILSGFRCGRPTYLQGPDSRTQSRFLANPGSGKDYGCRDAAPGGDRSSEPECVTMPDDPCFLQFTSGSTSAPRGVVVTHRNLIANSRAIIEALEIDPDRDRAASWLPLYHDMGLIGFVIATLVGQVPVVIIPTIAFVKHPGVWMETVHKYRATITFGPNFAFDLASKRIPRNSRFIDLSCLRVLGCGAEPINPRTMERFLATFAQWGLKSNSIMPCYGMAEATLQLPSTTSTDPYASL